jgi:hypothetical protein
VPVTFREARRFVGERHRHNVAPNAWKFGVGVHDGEELRGVGIAGNPNSRMLDDGVTLELLRVCTDGAPNACSMIYGALVRAGKALGYERFITYTLASEPGSSLKAAGFVADKEVSGDRSWWRPSRPTATPDQNLFGEERRPMGDKIRWVKGCNSNPPKTGSEVLHIDGTEHGH